MPRLAVLIALLALLNKPIQAQDSILAQCKRNGWIFIPKMQQKSWQAIMHCTERREPRAACESNRDCIAFTSNGASGNGWMYRLPRVKECGPQSDPKALDWEFEWSWVPMSCKDSGPCCGTYLANTAGVDAAFLMSCEGDAGESFDAFNCPGPAQCPTLHTTHQYFSIVQWQAECRQRRQQAGYGARHRALLGGTSGSYPAGWSKRSNPRSARKVAIVTEARSDACHAASDFCGDF